jgi:hypothetical protein
MTGVVPCPGFSTLAAVDTLQTLTIWTGSNIGASHLQELVDRAPRQLQVVKLYGCPCSASRDYFLCRDRLKDQLQDCRFVVFVEDTPLLEADCEGCQHHPDAE